MLVEETVLPYPKKKSFILSKCFYLFTGKSAEKGMEERKNAGT